MMDISNNLKSIMLGKDCSSVYALFMLTKEGMQGEHEQRYVPKSIHDESKVHTAK